MSSKPGYCIEKVVTASAMACWTVFVSWTWFESVFLHDSNVSQSLFLSLIIFLSLLLFFILTRSVLESTGGTLFAGGVTGMAVLFSAAGGLDPTVLLHNLFILGAALLLFLNVLAWGRKICTSAISLCSADGTVLAPLAGLGLLLVGVSLLGFLDLLYRPLFVVLLLGSTLLFSRDIMHLLKLALPLVRAKQDNLSARFCLCCAGFGAVILLVFSLSPPVTADALFYHLTVPERYLLNHGTFPLAEIPHSFYPALGDMVFLTGTALGDARIGIIFNTLLFLYSIGIMYQLSRRFYEQRHALIGTCWYGSLFLLSHLSTIGNPDILSVVFTLGSFYSYCVYSERPTTLSAVWSGLFAGFAVAIKFTSLFFPVALGVHFFSRWSRLRSSLRLGAAGLLAFFLPPAIWWVRNLVITGNPLVMIVGADNDWGIITSAVAHSVHGTSYILDGAEHSFLSNFLLPWNVTMMDHTQVYNLNYIGPLFLILLPLVLLRIRRKFTSPPWPVTIVGFLFWVFFIPHNLRYLAPLFPLLVLCSSSLLLDLESLWGRKPVNVLLLVFLVFPGWAQLVRISTMASPVVSGAISTDTYLESMLGDLYRVSRYIDQSLPAKVRVISLPGEERSYYTHRSFFAARKTDTGLKLLKTSPGNKSQFNSLLERMGVTHLYISNHSKFFENPWWRSFRDDNPRIALEYSTPSVRLYRFLPGR